MSSTLSIPGFMRSAIALPSNGVRFVEAGTEEAEQLSYQYNLSYAVEPHLRAMCSTTQGVVETVRWAREKDVRFAIRSGGHCFGATSSHPDLVIDLRELYGVSLDPTSRRLTAQPGAWLASLYRAGFAHSLAPSAGWCGDVGLGGHILGGGLGYLARANGLLCDHLKSATMVTADGSLLTCSAVENPDVFWACRGGGGGLGVLTSFEIELQPVGTTHSMRLQTVASPDNAAALTERWMQWSSQASRSTSSQLFLTIRDQHQVAVTITGLSSEPRDVLLKDLKTVADISFEVTDEMITSGTFEYVMVATVLTRGLHRYLTSHSTVLDASLSISELTDILDTAFAVQGPYGDPVLSLEAMGGAIADLSETETAFPYRRGAFVMSCSSSSLEERHLDPDNSDFYRLGERLWQYGISRGYTNYRDRSIANFEDAYWSHNLDRLRSIKRRVDPSGVFSSHQTVQY